MSNRITARTTASGSVLSSRTRAAKAQISTGTALLPGGRFSRHYQKLEVEEARNKDPKSKSIACATAFSLMWCQSRTRFQGLRASPRKSMMMCLCAFLVATIMIFAASTQLWSSQAISKVELQVNATPCTYEQLHVTFGENAPFTAPEREKATASQCWKVSENILRIPPRAILNYKSMVPLGHGKQSEVSKIYIALAMGEQCVATYKTDMGKSQICQGAWHSLFTDFGLTKRCYNTRFAGHLPAEYTGAVLFYAQRQAGLNFPGLLPTWAIVPPDDNHWWNRNHNHNEGGYRSLLRWNTSRDEGVEGIIMPYVHLEPLADVKSEIATSTYEVARIMLPAVQGVSFLNELGFAHQDILIKNVGVVSAESSAEKHAIVYDYGYLAFTAKNAGCSWGKACDYCTEDFFPTPRMDNPIQFDLKVIREITMQMLRLVPDKDEAAKLEKSIRDCTSIQQLASVLKQAVHSR